MPWISAIGPAVGALGQLFGGKSKKGAAGKASEQQTAALQQAINTYMGMYGTIKDNTQPFITGGQTAEGMLMSQLPTLTKPFGMTEADLQQTPGYQFALNQGLKSIQNGFAAKGLGSSGAAMGGAGQFATGLADQTYGNQFNRYWQQNQNIANLLSQPIGYGLTANGQLTDATKGFAQMIGGAQAGIGNAQAAGTTAGAAAGANGLLGALGQVQAALPDSWGGGGGSSSSSGGTGYTDNTSTFGY